MSVPPSDVRFLLRQLDAQKEMIRSLKSALGDPQAVPVGFCGLTQTEAAILSVLASRQGLVTYDQIRVRVWGTSTREPVQDNTIHTHVCRIRSKLARPDIEIQATWREGYTMPPAAKAALREMLQSGEGAE